MNRPLFPRAQRTCTLLAAVMKLQSTTFAKISFSLSYIFDKAWFKCHMQAVFVSKMGRDFKSCEKPLKWCLGKEKLSSLNANVQYLLLDLDRRLLITYWCNNVQANTSANDPILCPSRYQNPPEVKGKCWCWVKPSFLKYPNLILQMRGLSHFI